MSHHIYLKRYASVYENFEFPYYKLKERKGRHRNNICTFHVVSKSCNIFFVFSTNFLYKKASPIHAVMDNDDACIYNPLLQMPLHYWKLRVSLGFEFLGKRPKTVGNLSPYGIS